MLELTKYNIMCSAITECHLVDEVAEIRNKARAMEVYAKQAMNLDAERQAVEIRIRAERKAGQLLKGMEKSNGGGDVRNHSQHDVGSEFKQAKVNSGISDAQGERWQKLATIPDQEFEESVRGKELPTTTGIIRDRLPKQEKPMDKKAVALWGEVQNFNRIIQQDDIKYLLDELTDSMKASVFIECEQIISKCEVILSERF